MNILGIDEVGRGCLAGDVYAAGVLVKTDSHPVDGITDSKKLTARRRSELSAALRKCHEIKWVIESASVQEIDRIGIGRATETCFRNIINKMMEGTEPISEIIIDGNAIWAKYAFRVPTRFEPKADANHWSVGAASILAKVARDTYMEMESKNYPAYGWDSNKGYGSAAHIEALRQHGLTSLHRNKFCATALSGHVRPVDDGVDLITMFEAPPVKQESDPAFDLPDLSDIF